MESDEEKQEPKDRDYESTDEDASSPDTSTSSSKPMLRHRPHRLFTRRRSCFIIPARIMRYLCWVLLACVVLFIFALIRMSQLETQRLQEAGDQRKNAPKQWEKFPFLQRYNGGVRSLVTKESRVPEYPPKVVDGKVPEVGEKNKTEMEVKIGEVPAMKVFSPYPDYKSAEYVAEYASVTECWLDEKSKVEVPDLHCYEGRPQGFPDNIMGSYDLLGLESDLCFDRYGRLGPYGHGYSLRKGGLASGRHGDMSNYEQVWKEVPQYDYRNVNWAAAQERCYAKNTLRFRSGKEEKSKAVGTTGKAKRWGSGSRADSEKKTIPRTAVVIRTWDTFDYHEEDILYLRSLVNELSLGSGGEYDIHLLVQLKDESIPVFSDDKKYQAHLAKSVPAEFRGMASFWSEKQMEMLYPGLEETLARGPGLLVTGVYRGLVLALQWWAHKNPQYDFVWQWEMDIRYTGHWYDLFKKMDRWTEKQPRKYLWERNARFYIPSVHGSWEDFSQMVRIQTEQGTPSAADIWKGVSSPATGMAGPRGETAVWGPQRPVAESDWFEIEEDPVPPTSFSEDEYKWGVGEPADLITLNPLFDPEGTTWGLSNDATGYNTSNNQGFPPRRASMVTASRLSRRLVETMHRETAVGKHHAFPEMWAGLAAITHGYKAVYAPHPMFVDREWPLNYLASVMNGGKNGASGGARTSVFGDSEHNLQGMNWFYNGGFAGNLWRHWLGLKADGQGESLDVVEGRSEKSGMLQNGEGRMCVPPMLLHPVKGVELPVEEVVVVPHETEEDDHDPAS